MRFRQSAQGGISTHNRKAHHTTTFFKALSRLAYFFIAVAIISCGSSNSSSPPPPNVAATTQQYVENFYPLWFTYNQSQYVGVNHFVGPDRVSPIYQIVVAINVDTIYASTFASVASQPLIVTIPSTQVTYSALVLDAYGDIFTTKMQSNSPGVYGLTGPGFNGTLPQGVTQVSLPVNFVNVIIRADRFSPTGVDQTNLATQFRDSLMTQTLTDYLANPSGGATLVVPEAFTSVGFKTDADNLIADDPVSFLEQLQVAVGSSNTPPLSKSQKQLVKSFNRIFKNGDFNTNQKSAFVKGTQDAYNAILGSYLGRYRTNQMDHFR